jgi:hypothetical protein
MKRAVFALAFVFGVLGGAAYFDATHPRVAEAGGWASSGSTNLNPYVGTVGLSGAVAISGPNSTTGLTINMAAAGRALSLVPDTTTPTNAALFFARQDANPTSGALGDVFLFGSGSVQVLRHATSNTPRWDDVAAVMTVATENAFATGGQASATTICDEAPLTYVGTVASAADSVKWPLTPILGKVCELYNKGANALTLYPNTGGILCVQGGACLAANAGTSVAANAGLRCWHQGSNVWNCR